MTIQAAMKWLGALALTLVMAQAMAISDESRKEIKDRIAPVGEVCVQGEDCAGQQATTAQAGGGSGPRSGQTVYESKCSTCHKAGVSGAPKLGDATAWADRIAKGKETLYKHSINGFNAMPPKGTCMSCSDKELKNAVDYMVKKSK